VRGVPLVATIKSRPSFSALTAWTLVFGREAGVKGRDRFAAASRP